jgi:hypothetical protein
MAHTWPTSPRTESKGTGISTPGILVLPISMYLAIVVVSSASHRVFEPRSEADLMSVALAGARMLRSAATSLDEAIETSVDRAAFFARPR